MPRNLEQIPCAKVSTRLLGGMRIGMVVQRYGLEVNGGAELLCRLHAEHLVQSPEVDKLTVFTTCARDHGTWANHYERGNDQIAGVSVERFPVIAERFRITQSVLGFLVHRHLGPLRPGIAFEPAWFLAQGPFAPGLLKRLARVRDEYDVFVFYTYLYFPTVFGLPLVARKSVLVPTAHDERPIYMAWYRWLFRLPRAFAFLTPEEQQFVERKFGTQQPSDVVGMGINAPDDGSPGNAEPPIEAPPYILYVGRVEPGKGLPELLDAFVRWKQRCSDQTFRSPSGRTYFGRDLKLVMAGRPAWIDLPKRDDVAAVGFVSDEQKSSLLRNAELFVLPSRFESLSIVLLEAWAHRKAVLVNSACEVTRGQVERSGGGEVYAGCESFSNVLSRMLSDPERLVQLGESGRAYTDKHYTWDQCQDRMLRLFRGVVQG